MALISLSGESVTVVKTPSPTTQMQIQKALPKYTALEATDRLPGIQARIDQLSILLLPWVIKAKDDLRLNGKITTVVPNEILDRWNKRKTLQTERDYLLQTIRSAPHPIILKEVKK